MQLAVISRHDSQTEQQTTSRHAGRTHVARSITKEIYSNLVCALVV